MALNERIYKLHLDGPWNPLLSVKFFAPFTTDVDANDVR